MKTTWANAAKLIRNELKVLFPNTKFTITSEGYSGGSSVNIDWIDGPTSEEVMKHAGRYEYGHFDAMQDLYEYSNSDASIPQVRYVMTHREMSAETKIKIMADLEITQEILMDGQFEFNGPREEIWRKFSANNF